jgi:replication initiation protein RepC
MEIHDGAHAAPQKSFTHSPTGFRRMTPGLLKADRAAEKFNGLPEGVQSHGQLLAAFKEARSKLGISARIVHAVDFLFCFTQPQDWHADSRPIVWPSNEVLRTALGLEKSQVKEIIRRLIELGLVTMKDSPNGKRYGNRVPNNPLGRITEAYGFDLSIFAISFAEFVRLGKEIKAERAALAQLRRKDTIARKAISQILETASEYGLDGDQWETLARETKDLISAMKDVERVDEMETGVRSLQRRQEAARERLEMLLGTVETDPKEPENRTHIYNYNPTADLNKDTVIAAKGCSSPSGTSYSQNPRSVPDGTTTRSVPPARPERTDKGLVDRTSADELARLAPKLRDYLRRPDPNWSNIVDAADWLRGELGVSKSLWDDACITMGRNRAAMALAPITSRARSKIPAAISAAWSKRTARANSTSTRRFGAYERLPIRITAPAIRADQTAAICMDTADMHIANHTGRPVAPGSAADPLPCPPGDFRRQVPGNRPKPPN